jgi:phage terminase large subunit-like protein
LQPSSQASALPQDPATCYALDVIEGRIPACKWVRLACRRHLHDLRTGKWLWDIDEVLLRIKFFALLRHVKGPCAGNPFHLEPWQCFVVGSVYGWKHPTTRRRRFRYVYDEVPRKNGKTFLAAGFALMGLICGGSGMQPEPGAEVYSVATKEDQSKLVWRDVALMAKRSPGFSDFITTRLKEIRFEAADAVFKPLGADSLTLDGLNPYVAIMDELHAWPNRDLWDVITDGQGARAEPLVVQITTAGYNQTGICYEQRKHVCSILEGFENGTYEDDAYFGIIYTIDEKDDPFDEAAWFKANPNLNVSKSLDYMRDEAARARIIPSKRNAFLNKQLNVWTEQENVWLPLEKWDRCAFPVELGKLPGNPCVGAIDLASTNDIAAVVWEFRVGDRWHFVPRFFIPEDNMRERVRRDRVPYDAWARDGLLTATPGDVIDYEFIRAQIIADAALFKPTEITYDAWNATDTVTQLQGAGLNMVPCRQGFITMSPAMKALETEIVSARVAHGGNPILRWMLGNVSPQRDAAGNIKPDKARSREKIDGIVAMIMAHSRLMLTPEPKKSRYESSGPLVL